MSKLRNHPNQFKQIFLAATYFVTAAIIPFCLCFILTPETMIITFFGEQYRQAAPYLRFLGPVALLMPLNKSCEILYISTGTTRKLFVWGLIMATCLASAFAIGLKHGVSGISAAYTLALTVTVLPGLYLAGRACALHLTDIIKTISTPIIAACCAVLVHIFLSNVAPHCGTIEMAPQESLVALTAGLTVYICIMIWDLRRKALLKPIIAVLFKSTKLPEVV